MAFNFYELVFLILFGILYKIVILITLLTNVILQRRSKDLASIYFMSNASIVIIFSYLILLMDDRGISEVEIALLAVPFSISLIVSNSLFGRMSDVKGRRPFLLLGLLSSSLTTIFYIFPQNVIMFAIARILNGITLGIFPSSIIGTASDRNLKLGKISSIGSIGWAFGGLSGGFIADYFDLEIAFIAAGGMYFLAFLTTYWMNTGTSFTGLNSINSPKIEPQYTLVIRKNWIIYLILVLRHGFANSIWIFWALFLIEDLGLSTSQMGVIQATNMLTQFVVMSTIADKYDPGKMFLLGGILSAVSFFSFPLANNFEQLVATQVLLGLSWALFYVGGLRFVEINSKPDGVVATGTGLFNASLSIAQLVGPFIALLLFWLSRGYTLSMNVAGTVTAISMLFFVLLTKINQISHLE